MTEQQQFWPVDRIDPDPFKPGEWLVHLKGYDGFWTSTTDQLVAAGITPPRPPIVVTSGGRSIKLDPDDVAVFVREWEVDARNYRGPRVAVALANLLADQEPT